LHGRIVNSRLSYVGKQELPYGYLGIVLEDGTHINVKVDVYTMYETLTVGDEIYVEVVPLGSQGVLVAKRITYTSPEGSAVAAKADEVSSPA
jgi:hypothetical protein